MASHAQAHTTHDNAPRSAPRRPGASKTAPQPRPQPRPRADAPDSGRAEAWLATLAACVITGLGLWLTLQGPLSSGGPSGAPQPFLRPNGLVAAGPVTTFTLVLSPAVPGAPAQESTARLAKPLRALQLQIVVPRAEGRYEVRVQSGARGFDYGGLSPRTLHGIRFVQISIPRARLSSGTYQVLLLRAGSGPARLLHSYSVRVVLP